MLPGTLHPTSAPMRLRASHFLRTAMGCCIVYLVILEAFLAVPAFNGVTQIRPASGLGPTLGLMFGLPGAFGCAVGNLISDILHFPNDPWLPAYFVIQLIYAYGLRAWWNILFGSDAAPRLASAKHLVAFLIGAMLDALLVTLLLLPLEGDTMQALNIHMVHLFNNFLALTYIAPPTMLLVQRVRRDRGERSLSERFVLVALFAAAIASILCVAIMFAFRIQDGNTVANSALDESLAFIYPLLTTVTICLFGLACAMLAIIEHALAQPLNELAIDARTLAMRMDSTGPERMRDGELDIRLTSSHVLDEIALVAHESNEMRHALATSMIEAQTSARERERISTELGLASTIQTNALPLDFSDLESTYSAKIDAIMRPARTVGGDFYDVFPLDDHRLCVLVADVSDKGVPAALFMMRAMAETRECLRSASTLGEGLSHASSHLCANNDAMLFVTMFVVALNARTGNIEFANAGHNLPMLLSATHGNRWLKAKPGLPLGVMEDFYYETGRSKILPGEQVVLYTDGVTEARSAAGELFGDRRLEDALNAAGSDSPVAIVERAVTSFSEGAEQADDLTVLSLCWLPETACGTFAADANLCMDICEFVHSHISDAAVENAGFNLDLIVEELFVNVATHAYEGAPSSKRGVDIFVADDVSNNVVHILLQDSGVAYDPTLRKISALTGAERLEDLEVGGMGLLLVRKLSDSMRYERFGDHNILHVTKHYGL